MTIRSFITCQTNLKAQLELAGSYNKVMVTLRYYGFQTKYKIYYFVFILKEGKSSLCIKTK